MEPIREQVTGNRVRVLLADDHPAVRESVLRLLAPEYDVVGAVGDGQSLIDAMDRLRPDVLVLDISMPVMSGIQAARRIKEAGSQVRIVFLTIHEDPEFVRETVAVGALGFVSKPRLASDLPLAIREVLAGRSFVSPTD